MECITKWYLVIWHISCLLVIQYIIYVYADVN